MCTLRRAVLPAPTLFPSFSPADFPPTRDAAQKALALARDAIAAHPDNPVRRCMPADDISRCTLPLVELWAVQVAAVRCTIHPLRAVLISSWSCSLTKKRHVELSTPHTHRTSDIHAQLAIDVPHGAQPLQPCLR